ncbi:MAG: hypothetical protein GY811_08770 [Myxococcales bacterium]|nr:hypothetical protein [Myxococcales bacterium]
MASRIYPQESENLYSVLGQYPGPSSCGFTVVVALRATLASDLADKTFYRDWDLVISDAETWGKDPERAAEFRVSE